MPRSQRTHQPKLHDIDWNGSMSMKGLLPVTKLLGTHLMQPFPFDIRYCDFRNTACPYRSSRAKRHGILGSCHRGKT